MPFVKPDEYAIMEASRGNDLMPALGQEVYDFFKRENISPLTAAAMLLNLAYDILSDLVNMPAAEIKTAFDAVADAKSSSGEIMQPGAVAVFEIRPKPNRD